MSRVGWPWLSSFEPFPELAAFRPVLGEHGSVSAPHATASRIGLDVLQRGGNAVDAAIATSASLMVTCPMQCGPGGDAFWLIALNDGRTYALDASGRSPSAADAEFLRAQGLSNIPARSGYAITAPGAIDGWVKAHAKFGSMEFRELLEPATVLAEEGIIASRHIVASFRTAEAELRERNALHLWSSADEVPSLYGKIHQPALGATLRSVADTGGRVLYEGVLAKAIADASSGAGGWLSEEDLAAYEAEWVRPVSAKFREATIFTTPPSTQGFGLLAALQRIEAVSPGPLDRNDPVTAHLLIEAVAAGLELRDAHNQDRSKIHWPIDDLWSDLAVKTFADRFDPRRRSATASRLSSRVTKGDTAHLAVIDRDGMSVSLIQSLFFDFGTCVPVPEGGFTLQNRGAGFQLDPGEAGLLAPRIRPPSTLIPTIACKDGQPFLSIGCMGGDGQIQVQVQMLVDILDSRLDPQQAISRPRWYLDRNGSDYASVKVEAGVNSSIVNGLRERGHLVHVLGPSEEIMGHVQIVERSDGVLIAGADPRSDGQATAF